MIGNLVAYLLTAFFLFMSLAFFLNAIDLKNSDSRILMATLFTIFSLMLAYGSARLGGI